MADSNTTREIKNIKTNMKHKFYSKTSLDEKCGTFLKKKYSLKPCHVPLPKIDDEAHLDNMKQSSQDLNQSIAGPCTENKVHSKTPKIKSFKIRKTDETSRDLEKSVSTISVQHNHNVSASSSVVNVCDRTSCYVALERLAIPVNHFSVYSSEKEGRIKNFAMCNEYHSQPSNVEVDCNYKKIQECSFEMKMPHSESTLIHSLSDSYYQLSEDSIKGSFISESQLSTPTSSVESDENRNIVESNSFLPGISSVSSENKGIIKGNDILLTSTRTKRRRISSFGSDFSKLDAGKDTETLDNNENTVKTNESLSPAYWANKEAKEFEDLNSCMKRNIKLLSSNSESSSTVKNQYSFRGRKGAFFQEKHKKRRKCQIKRDLSYPDSNSSGDSDSTVFNSSLATANSYKQTLKKRKIKLTTTSSALCNQTALNGNVEKTCSVDKDGNTHSKMFDKNRNVFISKFNSSNRSETDEKFSDNSLSNANEKMSKHKQSKCSFRGKHIRAKRVHVSNLESVASDISSNSERGQECNRSFKYDLKPCCVFLVDMEKNNVISNTGNQFNDLHQKDSPKAVCEIDCLKPNSSKQINFSKRTKMSKSLKCIEKESFDDNKDYTAVKECIVLSDSDNLPEYEKGHIKKGSSYVDTNSVHESQGHSNESHCKILNKQVEELGCYFSDTSDSLPNLDTIFRNSEFLKEEMKSDSSANNSSAENSKKVLNYKEVNSIVSSRKCSSVNKENDKLDVRVICDDPDWDEAYLADTDEGSDNLESAPKNCNSVSADNCKPSADLNVNVLRNETDGKNTEKKIPYCYLGLKKKCGNNDDRFLFRSKTNGSVYIVDFFEYENIEKMFVTIHWKKGTLLYSNNDSNRNSSPTLSERIEVLGGFNRIDAKICLTTHATSGKNQHENKQKYLGKENLILFDKGEVLNTKKNLESLNTDCSKPGPSCLGGSLSDDTTLSNSSSDHSDNNKYDDFCVHCCAKFSSKRESYNHTCDGKLQNGYLCIYCETIFSSYSKLQSHRALHFI